MTVMLVSMDRKMYQCLSSDELPDAVEGSTLHMVDTGEEYVRHDGGWVQDKRRARAIHDAATM